MPEQQVHLKQSLGFWWLYTLGVGAVVGDGVFTFTGYGVASAGPSLIWIYILVGFLQMFLMLSFGELVIWRPSSGGPETWVRELVSPRWGAVASLMFSMGWVFTGGTSGLALGVYTHNFLHHAGMTLQPASLWVTVFAILWVTFFAYLNIRGVDLAAKVQFGLVLALIALMVLYEALTTPHIEMANYLPMMPNGWKGFFGGIPVATYAFMGASTVLFASEEARNPVDVSRVLLWSSLTFIVVYSWALVAAVGTLSQGEVQKFYESIYVSSANKVLGPVFANLVNIGAWLAAATCVLMGTIFQPSRDLYNLARVGYRVPRWCGFVHPAFRTPSKNIIAVWVLVVAFILLGQVAGQTMIFQLMGYGVVWVWCVSWTFTMTAAFKFREKHAELSARLPWRVPLWPLTPLLGSLGIAFCAFALFLDLYNTYGLKVMAGFAAAGIALVLAVYLVLGRLAPVEGVAETKQALV